MEELIFAKKWRNYASFRLDWLVVPREARRSERAFRLCLAAELKP